MRERIRLKTGKPDSKAEREADLRAEEILRGKETALKKPVKKSTAKPFTREQAIQFLDEKIEEARSASLRLEKAKENNSNTIGLKSKGEPLSEKERDFFETRFGHDLSGVRVHTDSDSAKTAEELGARAFTAGNDIVFGRGEYAPESFEGKKLMAHELAHVTQEGAQGAVQYKLSDNDKSIEKQVSFDEVIAGIKKQAMIEGIKFQKCCYDVFDQIKNSPTADKVVQWIFIFAPFILAFSSKPDIGTAVELLKGDYVEKARAALDTHYAIKALIKRNSELEAANHMLNSGMSYSENEEKLAEFWEKASSLLV